jgi:phosphoribosylglycinamide formyltransferase 2
MEQALRVPGSKLRLFGKPDARAGRRMGVALAIGEEVDTARRLAADMAAAITVHPVEPS